MANQEGKIYKWGITPFNDLIIGVSVQSSSSSSEALKLTYQQVKAEGVGILRRKISAKEILNYWKSTPTEEDYDLELIYSFIQEHLQLEHPIGLYNRHNDSLVTLAEDRKHIDQFLEDYPHWVVVEDYETGEMVHYNYNGDPCGVIHLHCLGEVDEAESKGAIEKEKEKSETMFPMLEPETEPTTEDTNAIESNPKPKVYNWGITPFHDLVIGAPVQSSYGQNPKVLKLTYPQVKNREIGKLIRKISAKEILNYWLGTPVAEDRDIELIYSYIQEYHKLEHPIGLYNNRCITLGGEEDRKHIDQFLEVYPQWVVVEEFATGVLRLFHYEKGDEGVIIHLHCLPDDPTPSSVREEQLNTTVANVNQEPQEPIIIELLRQRNRLLTRLNDTVSKYRLGYEDHGTTMDPDTHKTIKDMETNLIALDQKIFEADMGTSTMDITINPWLIRTLSNIISNHIATNESIWEPENTDDSLKLHYLTKLVDNLNHYSLEIFGQSHEFIQNQLYNIEKGNM